MGFLATYVIDPSLGTCQPLTYPSPPVSAGRSGQFSQLLLESVQEFYKCPHVSWPPSLLFVTALGFWVLRPGRCPHPYQGLFTVVGPHPFISPRKTLDPDVDSHALYLNTGRYRNEFWIYQLLIPNVYSRAMSWSPSFNMLPVKWDKTSQRIACKPYRHSGR